MPEVEVKNAGKLAVQDALEFDVGRDLMAMAPSRSRSLARSKSSCGVFCSPLRRLLHS